jgi:hypothetical protein
MSIERGWAALNLECPPEIPRTEYLSNVRYVKFLTGLDPNLPEEAEEAWRQTCLKLDYDFSWLTYDGVGLSGGRKSWMGTATFSENQQNVRRHEDGYASVRAILDMDPETEYPQPAFEEVVADFQKCLDRSRAACPCAIVPGGIYNSVFTWCILAFGWEMFMEAAMDDPVRFDEIMEGFFRISERNVAAWLQTDLTFFLCHDDIVWSAGPVFHPDWYRKNVIARYERLWKPIRKAGKKLIFCSDGNYTVLVDDLVAAGAEGFIFEPLTSLEYIAEKYGQTHVIIGNADCRILQRGPEAAILAEVERCYQIGRHCPGYFFAVGNHIPYNIPVENVDYYMKQIEAHRRR